MLSERFNPTKKSDVVSVAEMWSKTTERDIREELKKPSQNRRRCEGSFYPDADGRHAAEQSRPGGGGTWLHHRRGDERRNRRRFRRNDSVTLIFPRLSGKQTPPRLLKIRWSAPFLPTLPDRFFCKARKAFADLPRRRLPSDGTPCILSPGFPGFFSEIRGRDQRA